MATGKLKWFNPKGKVNATIEDFQRGLKGAIGKNNFKNMATEDLENAARWLGHDIANYQKLGNFKWINY